MKDLMKGPIYPPISVLFRISINNNGVMEKFVDKNTGNDYLAKNTSAPYFFYFFMYFYFI